MKLTDEQKAQYEPDLWKITESCYTGVEVPERELFRRCVKQGDVFVYFFNHAIIGYALYTDKASYSALLRSVAVLPALQKDGVGESLLRESAEYYKGQDFRSITLHCKVDNADAQRLYLKLGWRVTAVLRNYYKPEGDGLEMRKAL